MKRLGLIGWMWVLAIAPLLAGSALFWYSYVLREYYAVDGGIEVAAFFTILGYLLLGVSVIVLGLVHLALRRRPWWQIIPPLTIVLITFPVIVLYGAAHDAMTSKCYVRISKDVQVSHYWIWSAHFTSSVACDEGTSHVISYTPVYTYDWDDTLSSVWPPYKLAPVYLSVMISTDSISTFELPRLERGQCQRSSLSEIMLDPAEGVQRERFPRVVF